MGLHETPNVQAQPTCAGQVTVDLFCFTCGEVLRQEVTSYETLLHLRKFQESQDSLRKAGLPPLPTNEAHGELVDYCNGFNPPQRAQVTVRIDAEVSLSLLNGTYVTLTPAEAAEMLTPVQETEEF